MPPESAVKTAFRSAARCLHRCVATVNCNEILYLRLIAKNLYSHSPEKLQLIFQHRSEGPLKIFRTALSLSGDGKQENIIPVVLLVLLNLRHSTQIPAPRADKIINTKWPRLWEGAAGAGGESLNCLVTNCSGLERRASVADMKAKAAAAVTENTEHWQQPPGRRELPQICLSVIFQNSVLDIQRLTNSTKNGGGALRICSKITN